MDILRVLSATDLEVRRKTLNLALDLVSSRNIEEMVLILKKEVIKTNEAVEQDDATKYRQLLVRTLHQCTVKFPDVATNIIPVVSAPYVTRDKYKSHIPVRNRQCSVRDPDGLL